MRERIKQSEMSAYNVIYAVLAKPLIKIFRVKITGRDNLPPKESRGYLLCANHTSLWDVFVLNAALDRQVKFMAKKELFKIPVLNIFIKMCGAFPVNRGSADIESIKTTINLLEKGDTVGVFPQGTRCAGKIPRNTEVKHGVGLLSYRAKCGVIPVFIKTEKRQVKFFRKTELVIGKTIEYEDLGFEHGGLKEYKGAAEKIFDRICCLDEEDTKKENTNTAENG